MAPFGVVRGDDSHDDDGSHALIGYGAAVLACLAFGSFAVPIKSARANRIHVDPLVMQTYKTVVCFLTCWILLLFGKPFSFTPWGLLSGLFWVPGGTAGIYAVRSPVGLAMSQSIWSALKLLVGFSWGILIFHESVRSKSTAFAAIMLMMFGLTGMSFSASSSPPTAGEEADSTEIARNIFDNETGEASEAQQQPAHHGVTPEESIQHQNDNDLREPLLTAEMNDTHCLVNLENNDGVQAIASAEGSPEAAEISYKRARRLGLLCAVIDGAYGGSILVPMHFAKAKSDGLSFVISFAIGALVVLSMMWILRISYACLQQGSLFMAFQSLPGFHLSTMWLPGGLAGLLWSIGNISSIVCVSYLGEGVGYCIVQSQMLVAGLWGVFYYREVQGSRKILGWLCCACLTIAGVLLLSHEHVRHSERFIS